MVIITFILGVFLGGLLGVFTMCAMISAGDADDREERYFNRKE